MPKLLQINVTANWGSTGKIAEQIGLKAMEHGWESYIAYGRNSNPSKSKLIKVGNMLNVYEHYLENRLFDNEGLASRIPTKKLIKQMEELKPDIIHLHNIHDHWLNYKILFEYFNSIDTPIVWTQHDCWAFTGGCMHFVHTNCEKWKNECEKCPQKSKSIDRSKIHFNLRKNFFSNVNLTLVPVSQWMGNFLQESFLKNKKIEVIHNGVDLNVFKPISDNKGKNKFQILAVSSVWHRSKGLYDVFKLRELLSEEYEITMVGLSADQVKQLPKGIIGIQRTQNIQELVKLYSESDVFINPTYADTFPTVNLEALACGTPVITYKTGGSPEAVDENTGVVIEQGDINAIAETIRQIQLNPLSSEACRKRAVELYDKNKCFDKYMDLYEDLLRTKNNFMQILVTGGAGFIGSHTLVELYQAGHTAVVVDNLSNSSNESLKRVAELCKVEEIPFYQVDIRDKEGLEKVMTAHKFDACIHFAGLKAVGESVEKPWLYYENNINGTLILMKMLEKHNCKNIIFSSSATIYGEPAEMPITENCPKGVCTNPYGWTKSMLEQVLTDIQKADKEWNVVLLRYFNPIGAHKSGRIGENPNGIPNNLMPYITQVAIGKREKLNVLGNDYNTADGTGVRDYIHVVDLAKAHVSALKAIDKNCGLEIYNVGTGRGYSVLEVVKAFEKANDLKVAYEIKERRPGDIAECYCNPQKIEKELGWKAENDLEDMCRDSWNWQKNNPNGY